MPSFMHSYISIHFVHSHPFSHTCPCIAIHTHAFINLLALTISSHARHMLISRYILYSNQSHISYMHVANPVLTRIYFLCSFIHFSHIFNHIFPYSLFHLRSIRIKSFFLPIAHTIHHI